jgi:hypothetical protein
MPKIMLKCVIIDRRLHCSVSVKRRADAVIKSSQQADDFFQAPNVLCNASFHRWRYAQSLVNAGKIVMHVMQGNRRFVVLNLL